MTWTRTPLAYRKRLRVQMASKEGFPSYFPQELLNNYFQFVDSRPDVIVLQNLDEPALQAEANLSSSHRYVAGRVPTMAFHAIDRWDAEGAWAESARRLASSATIVFGHNLPLRLPSTAIFVPLLCRSLVEETDDRTFPGSEARYELSFVGGYVPQQVEHVDWPEEVRTHRARGVALARLSSALRERRLFVARTDFWTAAERGDQQELARIRGLYRRILIESAAVFSPPGAGYNCHRHAEALAYRRLLLTCPLHERILLPEPELWSEEALGVQYAWDGSDLEERALWMLDNLDSFGERVDEGFGYYLRWVPIEAQLAFVHERLTALMS